ncbi:MAG: energy transducer TonB [Desulfosarcina sp.]|nr:energy transducer TonB [Desulfosarcina sp.]
MHAQGSTSAADRRPSANWLLRGLIVFSIAVHTVIFFHISGIYRSSTLTFIEMSLQNIDRPTARDIPRPRMRPKPPDPRDPVKKIHVVPKPVPRIRPLAMAPVDSHLLDSLMEAISAPEVPQMPSADSSDWVPGFQSHEAAGEFMTAASYLDMVRLKIESRKRYPEAAKARSVEGRVTIRFVLLTDGSVRDIAVVRGSRSKALNTAALAAIRDAVPFPRPPANLFKGDQPMELTIVFELT